MYLFVARLRHLTIVRSSLSRRSTFPTPNKDTFNIGGSLLFFPYIACKLFVYLILGLGGGNMKLNRFDEHQKVAGGVLLPSKNAS